MQHGPSKRCYLRHYTASQPVSTRIEPCETHYNTNHSFDFHQEVFKTQSFL
jgi:hypothetical protein